MKILGHVVSGTGIGFAFWLAAVACSSSGGGGGAAPCSDAGTCPYPSQVCQSGFCVVPSGSGGQGGGPSGGGGSDGGGPSGGAAGGGGSPFGGGGTGGDGGAAGGGGIAGGGGVPTGGGGGPSGGGGTGGGGVCNTTIQNQTCDQIVNGTTACGVCALESCCSQMNSCAANKECAGLLECQLTQCASATTQTELDNCVQQNCPACNTSGANTLLNAADSCISTSCASPCAG